ncbi:superoxide dismutase family protein [Alteraurantiacibacter buctensis]|uniref:Superoxide dismutase family protein n=1 Tax=Alteraurantiacibacter buctensis TaxID=1503981 RepID=A0A844YTL5_9SPHN|nr:superoxide dismutase family protein [Alteraurantiacibacter buctensis]MXO70188.1 superoxide dismutase family protein [Alteraurantiacibacter buctensis]
MPATLRLALTAAASSLALAACATTGADGERSVATATLAKADGTPVGAAVAMQRPDGRIELVVTVRGLSPGKHGVHVHTTGACQPTFAAAGGHWNPGGATHGLEGAAGQHAGDMPNIDVGANGTGMLTYALDPAATLAGMFDADGSAFVVHAGEDDQRTDPAGNSGDREACGVFVAR